MKKLTRRAAAELLQIDTGVVLRLALIAYSYDGVDRVNTDAWLNAEYNEKDNFLLRLYKALLPHLPNTSDVFSVLYGMQADIDRLIVLSRQPEIAGVLGIADCRFVKWPGYADWYDLWDVRRPKTGDYVEPSLRVTTAIHLYTVIQPLE